ncbi:MAG: hypothetical protein ACXWVD_00025 [Telluria sp.]
MTHTTHPTKEQVRDWLRRQLAARTPPPAPAQVRAELNWHRRPEARHVDP